MALTFEQMLARVLKHEGGFVNHPKDPGGATNKGITQAVYDNYRKSRLLKTRTVGFIADDEVADIYHREYFRKVWGDKLPSALAFQVFDGAVNSGVSRSIKWLQAAVGAAQDGVLGPKALAAVQAQPVEQTIENYLNLRLAFLMKLSTWDTFGRGWKRRIDENRAYAKEDLK